MRSRRRLGIWEKWVAACLAAAVHVIAAEARAGVATIDRHSDELGGHLFERSTPHRMQARLVRGLVGSRKRSAPCGSPTNACRSARASLSSGLPSTVRRVVATSRKMECADTRIEDTG